mmetsp:Transcript_2371/g.3695  ORF Transcript_2371/g.3695 Transcript_2371/m.3695 type:complete len:299 (-) Transcript_2371:96-992(-)
MTFPIDRILIFFATDAIGKIDKDSLSMQTLMELLIEHVERKDRIGRREREPENLNFWKDLHFSKDGESITRIGWNFKGLGGSLSFQWLPQDLQEIEVGTNRLVGTVEFCSLPCSLKQIEMGKNMLNGTADLRSLPSQLTYFSIGENRFDGSLDLANLPSGLETLHAYNNKFSGNICLENLPARMKRLSLEQNYLVGPLTFTSLPEHMEELYLNANNFSGPIILVIQKPMRYLRLNSNKFNGEVRIDGYLKGMQEINLGENPLEGTLYIDREKYYLYDCVNTSNTKLAIRKKPWDFDLL